MVLGVLTTTVSRMFIEKQLRRLVVDLFKSISVFILLSMFVLLIGCSPEVGSDEWCKDMKEKPKKDWTASETADYAKHCILK